MKPHQDHVKNLEEACHRFLREPHNADIRSRLLEALASSKKAAADSFPGAVQRLVEASHAQADALCLRILETNADPTDSVERETEQLCQTLSQLHAAMKR